MEIFESRPEAVNLADRKPGVLSEGDSKGPRQPGSSVPEELQELPGGQCGFGRWGWNKRSAVCCEVREVPPQDLSFGSK